MTTDLDFYELGILTSYSGQKGVHKRDILDGSPDDDKETIKVLRSLFVKKLVSFDKANDTFDFASLDYNL